MLNIYTHALSSTIVTVIEVTSSSASSTQVKCSRILLDSITDILARHTLTMYFYASGRNSSEVLDLPLP
jgi:hypothetical protein